MKPDLVMEAGNTAPGGGLENPEAQGMTVLTLDSRWRDRGTCCGGPARPTEDSGSFRARINRLVRNQGHPVGGGSFDWDIGTANRSRGTLQHDRAQVAASQIAGPRLLAVYPVTGWWEDRAATRERRLPYSAVVSVDLGEVDLDLYSPAALTLQPVPIDVDIEA